MIEISRGKKDGERERYLEKERTQRSIETIKRTSRKRNNPKVQVQDHTGLEKKKRQKKVS